MNDEIRMSKLETMTRLRQASAQQAKHQARMNPQALLFAHSTFGLPSTLVISYSPFATPS
jgi:hypothetical protein